jgi:hypothetical protein
VEKAARDVNDADIDPAVVSVFSSICDAMRGICKVQDKIVTASLGKAAPAPVPNRGPQPVMTNLGAIPKRARPAANLSLSQPPPVSHSGKPGVQKDVRVPVAFDTVQAKAANKPTENPGG